MMTNFSLSVPLFLTLCCCFGAQVMHSATYAVSPVHVSPAASYFMSPPRGTFYPAPQASASYAAYMAKQQQQQLQQRQTAAALAAAAAARSPTQWAIYSPPVVRETQGVDNNGNAFYHKQSKMTAIGGSSSSSSSDANDASNINKPSMGSGSLTQTNTYDRVVQPVNSQPIGGMFQQHPFGYWFSTQYLHPHQQQQQQQQQDEQQQHQRFANQYQLQAAKQPKPSATSELSSGALDEMLANELKRVFDSSPLEDMFESLIFGPSPSASISTDSSSNDAALQRKSARQPSQLRSLLPTPPPATLNHFPLHPFRHRKPPMTTTTTSNEPAANDSKSIASLYELHAASSASQQHQQQQQQTQEHVDPLAQFIVHKTSTAGIFIYHQQHRNMEHIGTRTHTHTHICTWKLEN